MFAPCRYDFDEHHDGIKQVGVNIDHFLFGMQPLGLVLFFGDLAAASAGFQKVNDAHECVLARVEQGAASAEWCVRITSGAAMAHTDYAHFMMQVLY